MTVEKWYLIIDRVARCGLGIRYYPNLYFDFTFWQDPMPKLATLAL